MNKLPPVKTDLTEDLGATLADLRTLPRRDVQVPPDMARQGARLDRDRAVREGLVDTAHLALQPELVRRTYSLTEADLQGLDKICRRALSLDPGRSRMPSASAALRSLIRVSADGPDDLIRQALAHMIDFKSGPR